VPGATVRATYVDDAGDVHDLALLDDGAHGDALAGDGIYANDFTAPPADGELRVRVEATGGSGSARFDRVQGVPIFVAALPDLAILPGDVTTSPAEPWAGDTVTATVTLRSLGERAAEGAVVLLEDDGVLVATATMTDALDVGSTREFALEFAAPLHAMTLTARVMPLDVDADGANDATSVAVGNVPLSRTAASLAGPQGAGDWYTGPVIVTLAPEVGDAPAGETILASLDGAGFAPYAGPFPVSDEGRHVLRYHATDAAGHVETTREVGFGLDASAANVALVSPAPGSVSTLTVSVDDTQHYTLVVGLVRLDVQADDGTSGLARLDVLIDGKVMASTTQTSPTGYDYLWDSTTASMGNHILTVRVTNGAGLAATASQHVYVVASRTAQVDRDPNATIARLRPVPE
jgi:hypothetical protein